MLTMMNHIVQWFTCFIIHSLAGIIVNISTYLPRDQVSVPDVEVTVL